MDPGDMTALIGALGGLEAVKWVVNVYMNRRTAARKEEAAADSLEDENERRQVAWLEDRITQRDTKIDALYAELRKEQTDKMEWIHKCHELELREREAAVRRCDVRGCANRIPPGEF